MLKEMQGSRAIMAVMDKTDRAGRMAAADNPAIMAVMDKTGRAGRMAATDKTDRAGSPAIAETVMEADNPAIMAVPGRTAVLAAAGEPVPAARRMTM